MTNTNTFISNQWVYYFLDSYLLQSTRWRTGPRNVGDTRRRSQSKPISPNYSVILTRRGRWTTPAKSVIARHLPNPSPNRDALKRRGRQLSLWWSEKRYCNFIYQLAFTFLMCSNSGWWSHHSFAKRPWRELGCWWSSQTFASRGSSIIHIRSPESPLTFAELACACVRTTERTWPLRLAQFVDEVDVSQIPLTMNLSK